MQKEADLRVALKEIQQSLTYLHSTLDQMKSLPEEQILTLQDSLADERDILINLAAEHRLPLELKAIDCKNITAEDYEEINQGIQQIEQEVQ